MYHTGVPQTKKCAVHTSYSTGASALREILPSRHAPSAIFPVVHERNRCFNWFIVHVVSAVTRVTMVVTRVAMAVRVHFSAS